MTRWSAAVQEPAPGPARCPRCSGAMFYHRAVGTWKTVWEGNCINCGEDPLAVAPSAETDTERFRQNLHDTLSRRRGRPRKG